MGDTYWGKNPYSRLKKKHLYFVINTPNEGNQLILVNMTKKGNIPDQSCILKPGEHKCIKEESVINYERCLTPILKTFKSAIKGGIFRSDERAEERLVKKIQKGAIKSPYFPQRFAESIAKLLQQDE